MNWLSHISDETAMKITTDIIVGVVVGVFTAMVKATFTFSKEIYKLIKKSLAF